MDYARAFANDASDTEVLSLFSNRFDAVEFAKELDAHTQHIWSGGRNRAEPVSRVFTLGVSKFLRIVGENSDTAQLANPQTADIVSVPGLPESHIASDSGSEHKPRAKLDESPFGAENEIDDSDDITNLSIFRKKPDADLPEVVDFSESDERSQLTETDITQGSGEVVKLATLDEEPSMQDYSDEQVSIAVAQIAEVLTVWFSVVSQQAKTHKRDVFSLLFGPPGSGIVPSDTYLKQLLARVKIFIEKAITLDDLERADSLRKLILLIQGILQALFVALGLDTNAANPNDVLVVKSLLFTFFQVDFSDTLQSLLDRTTAKDFPHKEGGNSDELKNVTKSALRLSYETVMKIYSIYISLANCPIDLIMVDKVSLSLDITTPQDTSPNAYTHYLEQMDFTNADYAKSLRTRFVAHLAAIYNYYYAMAPDAVQHSLRHSSFFGWITGNTLSSGLYLLTDTAYEATSFSGIALDPNDPFLYELDLYEHKKRLAYLKARPSSENTVKSPSYLALTFQIFSLLHNKSFVKSLVSSDIEENKEDDKEEVKEETKKENKVSSLLDIWLSVSSYVHHYQYRSPMNTFAARVSLLVMLRLTQEDGLQSLRYHKINENLWKLCHHRHPVIPLDENTPEKDALLYMVDVLQVTLRYNLLKKLDLENAKIALTVLCQILIDFEAHPSEGLRTYAWNELYTTLVNFLKFVVRTQNEVGVKYVIEEVFSAFQLLLSPVFSKVLVKTSDFFSLGYHPVKSINSDLMYIFLQQRETLEGLFEKFMRKKTNFDRVERVFVDLHAKISRFGNTELDASDVSRILDEISLLHKESTALLSIKVESFNYADTFRYFEKHGDYEALFKLQELVGAFVSLFETDWVGEGKKRV